jgi:prephenate dehydrogenase
MRAAIIGLGLIGGSLSLALRNSGFIQHIAGVENSDEHAAKALSLGLADVITDLHSAVSDADIVILAVPVNAAQHLLHTILENINSTAAIVDVGSTKSTICSEFCNHPKRMHFVAAHPIAGTEYSGPEAARVDLFAGRKVIICEPHNSADWALERITNMYRAAGADTIYYDSAQAHDKHAAYISHMSHVISFMLGQTVLEVEKDEQQILQMAGTGFASTVRLAKSSPDTWTPIFLQNAAMISQALQNYINNLQKFKTSLDHADASAIHTMISDANKIAAIIN